MRIVNGKLLGGKSNKKNETETKNHLKVLYQNVSEQKNNLQKFEELIQNIIDRQVNQNQTNLVKTETQEAVLIKIKNHLAQLEQRCDRLEASPQEFVMRSLGDISPEDIKQLKYSIEQQNHRLNYIEVKKIATVQQKLRQLEAQNSPHLVWIAIISSLTIGVISVINFYNWRQFNHEFKQPIPLELYLKADSNFLS